MAAIDPNLLALALLIAGCGILPAVLALRVEHRREALHAKRQAQIAAILGRGPRLSPR